MIGDKQPNIRVMKTNPFGRHYDVTIGCHINEEEVAVLGRIKIEELETISAVVCPPPCMSLTVQRAQVLMDDLWECGIRPSEGSGSAGSLFATQNHLADMKTLLFHKMGISRQGDK